MRILLSILFSVMCVFSFAQTYDTVKVDAPFEMPAIKVYNFPKKDFPITKYGAKPGGIFLNTQAIAKAITACNKAGGGRVVVPAGEWVTGAIHFKSNVDLHLEEGASLIFTDNPNDYLPAVPVSWEGLECYNYSPLVYAFECENIAISGRQIAVYGESNAHGGYGRVIITDKNGRTVVSLLVDFYSKVSDKAVCYISPRLPKGNYTLKVEVTGENSTWSDKKMSVFYGSDDYFVNIDKVSTKETR